MREKSGAEGGREGGSKREHDENLRNGKRSVPFVVCLTV